MAGWVKLYRSCNESDVLLLLSRLNVYSIQHCIPYVTYDQTLDNNVFSASQIDWSNNNIKEIGSIAAFFKALPCEIICKHPNVMHCNGIRVINLQGNRIEHMLSMGVLPNLEELYLNRNAITDREDCCAPCTTHSDVVCNGVYTNDLPNLRILNLRLNRMKCLCTVKQFINNHPKLEYVSLTRNEIKCLHPATLPLLPNIKTFSVFNNRIVSLDTESSLEGLRSILRNIVSYVSQNIEDLYIGVNLFSWDIPIEDYKNCVLEYFPKLKYLDGELCGAL